MDLSFPPDFYIVVLHLKHNRYSDITAYKRNTIMMAKKHEDVSGVLGSMTLISWN